MAELGIVLLLFVIGLELKLAALRRDAASDIFGLGLAAVRGLRLQSSGSSRIRLACAAARARCSIGIALAMSATAIALQMLDERGALQTAYGQRTFAVLLFQDMSIVPDPGARAAAGARGGRGRRRLAWRR